MNSSEGNCARIERLSEYPDILTVDQVASILQLSHNTVRSMLLRQEIRGKKVGQPWRVQKEDLLAYLDSQ